MPYSCLTSGQLITWLNWEKRRGKIYFFFPQREEKQSRQGKQDMFPWITYKKYTEIMKQVIGCYNILQEEVFLRILSCRKNYLFTHKPCVMSWSVPSFLATWGQIKVPCSTVSILPKCPSLLHTAFTKRVSKSCGELGTVLPLISVLTVKIRAARNCVSQLCQWLWANRWSFCQLWAAALLISHFLAFCALGKERSEMFFG